MRPWVFDGLVVLGVVVMTLGVIGIVRMPDVYTKLHAASKGVFLGVIVLAIAGMVVAEGAIISRLILISLILLMTTPVSSHVIGRAGFIVHETMETPGAIDESHSLVFDDSSDVWHPERTTSTARRH